MKKLFAISLIVLAGAAIFTSCKKDTTTAAAPTISFQGGTTSLVFTGTNSIDVNVTFAAEGKIESVSLSGPSLTGSGLTTKDITSKMGTSVTDNAKNQTSATYLFKVSTTALDSAFANHTTLTYTFTVTDQNSTATTGTFTVTKQAVSNPITTLSAKQLGGASNTTLPSYINLTTGTTYMDGTSCASVDLIFTYSTTSLNLMAAPNDATIDQAFPDIDNWSTKNATKFTALLSGITWANVTNDALITANVTTTAAANTRINSLAVGNIFGFITAAGKKGLIDITAIGGTTAADRSITFDIKVQQ